MNQKQFLASGNYLIDEVKRRSDLKNGHFFDKDTMKFFSSRISELTWQKGDIKKYQTNDIYFITSEADQSDYKHKGSIRAWTIRKADRNGNIKTISEFQEYGSLMDARKAIKEILE
tara:strand:- start:1627 stop:1974 length:348 start_codon:yes stop_codon:yes gene_type:complete